MDLNKSLFIGLLSGSSMDAVDVALVSFYESFPKLLSTASYPMPENFKAQCLELSQRGQGSIDDYGRLDVLAGELFAEAVLHLLKTTNVKASEVRAIGSHGQNLRHRPNAKPPFSLQIGDPNIIAERTGILTIADFRRRDLAAGGQGAPLAPGFHAVVFGHPQENRVIVNIGGISNITLLPKGCGFKDDQEKNGAVILGFDTGPGNCLMDSWVTDHWGQAFDIDGVIASKGKINEELLKACLEDPYFLASPPKSTGREYFNLAWLEHKIKEIKGIKGIKDVSSQSALSPQDIQATLLALTVESIAQMIHAYAPSDANIFVCGGGVHNTLLMKTLTGKFEKLQKPKPIQSTEMLGIPPDWVEAMLFAWLAKQTLEGKSGNCPSVTGAKHAIPLGGIFGHRAELGI